MSFLRMSIAVIGSLLLCFAAHAQKIQMLSTGSRASLRGLSAVSERTVWVSGNEGTVGRSTNGGKTWEWITVPGYESKDFRDIEAFDASTAVVMASGEEPGLVLKTVNGGKTWKKVDENATPGIFPDGMEFQKGAPIIPIQQGA